MERLDEIAEMVFHGQVPAQIAAYSSATQQFAHDMARELDQARSDAETAMEELKDHPLLRGKGVRRRARRVAGVLADACELAQGISAEVVKFNIQFRTEFADALADKERPNKRADYKGKVDL
ncbi:hypothetical protein [[Actinomadura] parvosata]|nr:hypothetical protein [Nonomuraea sp. ATCC 55076]